MEEFPHVLNCAHHRTAKAAWDPEQHLLSFRKPLVNHVSFVHPWDGAEPCIPVGLWDSQGCARLRTEWGTAYLQLGSHSPWPPPGWIFPAPEWRCGQCSQRLHRLLHVLPGL